MGLDNGIIVRIRRNEESLLPEGFGIDEWDRNSDNEFCEIEFCYWRKNYSFRVEVAEVTDFEDEGYTPLNIESLFVIRDILYKNIDKNYYDENYEGIWDYPAHVRQNTQNIYNISMLIEFLTKYPDHECYFYDSY